MQMHGKFEGFPPKIPLKQIGTFWGASHQKTQGPVLPQNDVFFFEIQGKHWWWPVETKPNELPIFNKIFSSSIRVHFYIAMLVYQGVARKFCPTVGFQICVIRQQVTLRFEQHAFRLKFWQGVIRISYLAGIKLDTNVDFWGISLRFVHEVWVGGPISWPLQFEQFGRIYVAQRWDSWFSPGFASLRFRTS